MKNIYKRLTAILMAVLIIISTMVVYVSAANTEASIVDSGIIGGVPKTVETDPLTNAINIGDYWYYDTDYPEYHDDSVKWTLDSNGVLTIFGNGGTAQFGKGSEDPANISANCPFYKNESIKTAVIESGVTYVSAWTFEQIPNLTTIIVMDAGTKLDNSWVRDCPNVETIIYGASLNNNTSDLRYHMAYSEKTLVLSKNIVQASIRDFILRDDCNIINYGLISKNNTIISYSEMLTRAKAALTNVPSYVTAKLPAELQPTGTTKPADPVVIDNGNNKFGDITPGAYYTESVNWAVEKGITNGTSNTTFSPDSTCTNAQILTMLYRAAGEPAHGNIEGLYADKMNANSYYYDAIIWAYEKGLIAGTQFEPDAPCTRESTVKFMWIAAGSPIVSTNTSFTDLPNDANTKAAIAWAVQQGITNGTSATTFTPNSTCTRAQIVTFLYRELAN